MPAKHHFRISATAVKVAISDPLPEGLKCLNCGSVLELHQPNVEVPDRLLAHCVSQPDACGSLHLLDIGPEGHEAVMVLLPGAEAIARALAEARRASH
jgi:hypothetical protein